MASHSYGFENQSLIQFHSYSFGELFENRETLKDQGFSVKHIKNGKEFNCTLTISGYGNVEGLGRIPITLSATAATCEEAAAELRPSIIEMELRLYE
jgi:hypothetical protein